MVIRNWLRFRPYKNIFHFSNLIDNINSNFRNILTIFVKIFHSFTFKSASLRLNSLVFFLILVLNQFLARSQTWPRGPAWLRWSFLAKIIYFALRAKRVLTVMNWGVFSDLNIEINGNWSDPMEKHGENIAITPKADE